MGYDYALIVDKTRGMLTDRPGTALRHIARRLQVSRHTIERALKRIEGVPYRSVQARAMKEGLDRVRNENRPLLMKELADLLGCSSERVLRDWIRRLT